MKFIQKMVFEIYLPKKDKRYDFLVTFLFLYLPNHQILLKNILGTSQIYTVIIIYL